MLPEDRLDALLPTFAGSAPSVPHGAWASAEDASLGPLLAAATQLLPLADQLPGARFALDLEQSILAHAGALAGAAPATAIDSTAPTLADSGFPTLPSSYGASQRIPAEAPALRDGMLSGLRGWRSISRRASFSRYPRLLPQAVAASLLLFLAVGALTAAAAAGPGSLLFPLHRLEQGLQVGLSANPADRVRLHLGYAGDALAALDAARVQGAGGATAYSQALATLRDEERAADQELGHVPVGQERNDLSAQLRSFEKRAIQDLRAALSSGDPLDWDNRVATTQVLGQLGEPVVTVATVHIQRTAGEGTGSDTGDDAHKALGSWQITITGTNFTSGAVVMVNGRQAGTLTHLSPTRIVVLVQADTATQLTGVVGVREADGTAAQATALSSADDGRETAPRATATPGSHSGDDHSGGDDRSGKATGRGTPTVPPSSPTPTTHP